MSRHVRRALLALSLAGCFGVALGDQVPASGREKPGQLELAALATNQTAALKNLRDGLSDLDDRVTRLESGSRNGR